MWGIVGCGGHSRMIAQNRSVKWIRRFAGLGFRPHGKQAVRTGTMRIPPQWQTASVPVLFSYIPDTACLRGRQASQPIRDSVF